MSLPDDVPPSPQTNAADAPPPRGRLPWVRADHPLADPVVYMECLCGWLATLDAIRHEVESTPLEERMRDINLFTRGVANAVSGTFSDAGSDDMPDLEEVDDSSSDEDSFREPYLQYIIAQRDCGRRREAEGLPSVACSRASPCYDCSAHPGAAATSIHWQTMSDARVDQELALYLRRRHLAPWMPPSPNSRLRMLIPSMPVYGAPINSPESSNQASRASSMRSEPPLPMDTLPSTSEPLPHLVLGPPRSPPAYEDLSDLSD